LSVTAEAEEAEDHYQTVDLMLVLVAAVPVATLAMVAMAH
jgi:hypothetical protein